MYNNRMILALHILLILQGIDALRNSRFQNDYSKEIPQISLTTIDATLLTVADYSKNPKDSMKFDIVERNNNMKSTHSNLRDLGSCQICTKSIWDVRSCGLESMKDSDMFGNFMVYGQKEKCYDNMCCSDDMHDCCRKILADADMESKDKDQEVNSNKNVYIIVGCIGGGLILGVLVVILLHYANHSKRSYPTKVGNEDIITRDTQNSDEQNKDESISHTNAQPNSSNVDAKDVDLTS